MKTHELARALALLARMLKADVDVELKDWPGPAKPKQVRRSFLTWATYYSDGTEWNGVKRLLRTCLA